VKLAFSLNAFRRHDVRDAIARIAEAGYAGVEIMTDTPHAWPPDLDKAHAGEIRRTVERHGLGISNINAFMMCAVGDFHHPSWVDPDPDRRALRERHTIASIRLAAHWGARTVSTQPGGLLEEIADREQALRVFADGLRRAADAAAAAGILLLIEPEPGCLISTAAQAQEFLDGLRHPALGINFDLGHLECVGEDPAATLRQFAGRVPHIHLEDIADRRHHHLVPGDGNMDFDAIFAALRDTGYGGWITVELYPYLDDAPAAAARARRALAHWLPIP
jgi:sugar phosphate isomerase/epimerase